MEGSSDEETIVDIDKILDVNSTICIEKEIAADTIGGLFQSTKAHFLPFVEQCTIELVGLLPHYYDGIRKSATDSLLEIVRSFYELSDPQEWQPGSTVGFLWSIGTFKLCETELTRATVIRATPLSTPASRSSSTTSCRRCWRCTRPKTTSTCVRSFPRSPLPRLCAERGLAR